MRMKAYKSHKTAQKSPARKRRLRKATTVSSANLSNVKKLLGM